MIKLTIEVESVSELIPYVKANDMRDFISDLGDKLRNDDKYGVPKSVTSPAEAIGHVREYFYELIDDYNIRVDGDY